MGILGAILFLGLFLKCWKKSIKFFKVKNHQTHKKFFKGFFIFQGLALETKFPQDPKNPQVNSKYIFYVLNNNFSHTQLPLLFLRQKNSHYVHDDIDAFFHIFFRKILKSVSGLFCVFFLLQKDFNAFHMLLFKAFLCFYDSIHLPFSYTEKKL